VDGVVLRGANRNSVALWLIGILGGVVLASDIVVFTQWLVRDRPGGVIYVFAGTVLALSTLVLAGVAGLAVLAVRRQRYALSVRGLEIPRLPTYLPWSEITAISPRSGRNGAVVVFAGRRPIDLDLSDVPGGSVRFLAAARWYADQAGVDLTFRPAPEPGAGGG
jgi:hypothetical protein